LPNPVICNNFQINKNFTNVVKMTTSAMQLYTNFTKKVSPMKTVAKMFLAKIFCYKTVFWWVPMGEH
jgi:hypothetical protein